MRYLAIIVSLFILSAQTVAGQSAKHAGGKFYLGALGGLNATAIFFQNNYGQTEMDYVVPVGFSGGVTMHYRLTPKSHLIVEASYHQMGQKHDDHFKQMDFYKDINLSYVAIPILYKLILNKNTTAYEDWASRSKPKWYLLAGIQPSFLISADIRYEVEGNQTDFISFITEGGNPNLEEILANGQPEDDADLYNQTDISFIGAAGFHTNIQPSVVGFVEVRGGFSLLDINAEAWQLPGPSGTYNWSRNLMIGFQVGLV
ncbi:MAG: hypothetical protein DRI69_08335, partial [Bacteroidetes bacterium]